jgi:hypothetical protein
MKTYTLSEIRDGTGFAPDTRFAVVAPESAPRVYSDALAVQSASNLSGIVLSWARIMTALNAQARASGQMVSLNRHPVNVLFAEQVYHLTGAGSGYSAAYVECTEKAEQEG